MKNFLLLCMSALLTMTAYAIPAKRDMCKTITLDNGKQITIFLKGDENGHRWEDGNGCVYVKNAHTQQFEQLKAPAASRRNAQQLRRRQPLRRIAMGGEHEPFTGSKKGIIILVQFSDMSFASGHDQNFFDDVANKENFTSTDGYKGSVHDYFYDQSRGSFDLTFDVVGPVTLNHPYSYYGQNYTYSDGTSQDMQPELMIVDACKAVDSQVNWSDYDWDGDGTVEQVFVLYAGLSEAQGGDENTVWPHEAQLSLSPVTGKKALTLGNIAIDTYACGSELARYDDYQTGQTVDLLCGIGTICHEFAHCLGLPDTYDTASGENYGMCTWDIMDSGLDNGTQYPGFIPAGFTAYERMYAGWLTPIELNEDTQIKGMKPLEQGGNAYIIYNDANHNEYYLLENRQYVGWDEGLEGNGLLITHVDFDQQIWIDNVVNCTSNEDYPNTHQRLHVVAADNSYGTYKTTYYSDGTAVMYYDYDDLDGDCYPWVEPETFVLRNDSLTNTSIPRANLYNRNTDGMLLLNKAVTNITQNNDGTIDFNFRIDTSSASDIGELFFKETFDKCDGTGGNDGKWGGSNTVASKSLKADNEGWTSNSKYGGNQCARFGNASRSQFVNSPEFAIDGEAQLTFKAAPWKGESESLTLSVLSEEDDFTLSENEFTMKQEEWTTFTTTIKGTGKLRLQWKPVRRFFLDEVYVIKPGTAPSVATGVSEWQMERKADNAIYTLDGRRVENQSIDSLPKGIYIKKGKKYVR